VSLLYQKFLSFSRLAVAFLCATIYLTRDPGLLGFLILMQNVSGGYLYDYRRSHCRPVYDLETGFSGLSLF
jgi:hypothetical protein